MLIIMGGSASVYDTQIKSWLTPEKQFIQKAIDAGKAVLGICLGAQLLAHTLGARVYPAPLKEIGWYSIRFNREELKNFSFLPEQINTFHWHGDTFDLPQGSIRFASSELTPNQGFLMGEKILALQFHLEMNLNGIRKLVKACSNELKEQTTSIQTAGFILAQTDLVAVNNQLMYDILDFLSKPKSRKNLKASQ